MLHVTYGHSFRGAVEEGETVESLTLTYGILRDGDDNLIAERDHDSGLWIRRSDNTLWTDIDVTVVRGNELEDAGPETKQMYALITRQGTAAAETALCADHFASDEAQVFAATQADSDIDHRAGWIDCTRNDALRCVVCADTSETDNRRPFILTIVRGETIDAYDLAGRVRAIADALASGYNSGADWTLKADSEASDG